MLKPPLCTKRQMTRNSAIAFLEHHHQLSMQGPPDEEGLQQLPPPLPPQQPTSYPVAAPAGDDDVHSDLVPSANTFIRKLYQMVTTEDPNIISFTSGTYVGLDCFMPSIPPSDG